MKILVLDSDKTYSKIIGDMLVTHDYDISYCSSFAEVSSVIIEDSFELVVFDAAQNIINLETITEWQTNYPSMAIFALVSNADDKSEVAYLKAGICDYVSKECSYAVIIERIKRCINKKEVLTDGVHLVKCADGGNVKIDTKTQLVTINGVIKHLTQLELDLLLYFVNNPNKVLGREEILRDVWKFPGEDLDLDTRTIDVHVKNLRRKLGIKNIYSIRGHGYRWYE